MSSAYITKRQVLEGLLNNSGPLANVADDEPIFVLRAQDNLSADLVEAWAIRAASQGSPYDKTRAAFDIADFMLRWPIRRNAD